MSKTLNEHEAHRIIGEQEIAMGMVDRPAQVHHDSVPYEDETETVTITAEETPSRKEKMRDFCAVEPVRG